MTDPINPLDLFMDVNTTAAPCSLTQGPRLHIKNLVAGSGLFLSTATATPSAQAYPF
jgi:hypothetical protein